MRTSGERTSNSPKACTAATGARTSFLPAIEKTRLGHVGEGDVASAEAGWAGVVVGHSASSGNSSSKSTSLSAASICGQ
jgi:hypothetical protein